MKINLTRLYFAQLIRARGFKLKPLLSRKKMQQELLPAKASAFLAEIL